MAVGADGRWVPGIGDPTALGWLTVAAYGLAAALAARAAVAATTSGEAGAAAPRRGRLIAFWAPVAVLLLLLGINKQLDLQSWLTQVLRDLSHQQGWYDDRRPLQLAFVAALAGGGTLGLIAMAVVLRRDLPRIGVALVGLGVLVTFVAARAASFHHMDALLRSGPLPLNWVAELGGLVLILLNAWLAGRSRV